MREACDWNSSPLTLAQSRGGVLATSDPHQNLLASSILSWPPAELVQKLYRSNQEKAFSGEDLAFVTKSLGYYCDLQSLHSEDAITWSVFGPVIYASVEVRQAFVRDLLKLIDIEPRAIDNPSVWLWRRIPHPDTLVSGGPEIDFGIQTDSLVLFGEAKWLSGVGCRQGKGKDKDQITLRREFFQKYGAHVFGAGMQFVVLGVSLEKEFCGRSEESIGDGSLFLRSTTWRELCNIASHPMVEELCRYLAWKREHSLVRKKSA